MDVIRAGVGHLEDHRPGGNRRLVQRHRKLAERDVDGAAPGGAAGRKDRADHRKGQGPDPGPAISPDGWKGAHGVLLLWVLMVALGRHAAGTRGDLRVPWGRVAEAHCSCWVRFLDDPAIDYRLVVPRRSGLLIAVLAVLQVACAPQASPAASDGPPSASASPDPGGSAPAASAVETGWTQLEAGGRPPAAREDHTWTMTPDGATAYLFGGRDGGTVYDDLWAYSLASDAWSSLAPSGERPPARFGHNAAWVQGIGLVVFAGQAGTEFFNDLWAYDPASNAWRSVPASGSLPVSRYGSCASLGPDGRLWISHGFTSEGQRFSDTRAYDFEIATWTDATPAGDAPTPRCLHACWWTDNGELALFGGQTTGITALGDLWRLTVGERPGTNAWTQLQPPSGLPPERNLYAAARWDAGTIVFGGQGLDGEYLADAWWISDNGVEVRLLDLSGAPSARSGSELVADAAGDRLLLFGGQNSTTRFDELWQLVPPAAT